MATTGSNTKTYTWGSGSVKYTQIWSVKSSSAVNNRYVLTTTLKAEIPIAAMGVSHYTGTYSWSYPAQTNPNYAFNETSFRLDQMTRTTSGQNYIYTRSATLTITGANVTGNAAAFAGKFQVGIIPSDGTASFSLDWLTVNPDALTRRSDPTVPSSITLGTNFAVTTNRINSIFTHTIQLKAGTQALTNIATVVGASKSDCNAPVSPWATYITTAASVTGTIRVITYENNQQVGYIDKSVTVIVPESCKPTITTPTIADTNGYYDTYGYFLSGGSILHLTWQETISYGSAIASRAVNIFGSDVTISGATNSGCDANITSIGTNEGVATVTITDGRGRTASAQTQSFKIFAYNKPVVGNSVVYRSDANGDSVLSGDHISIRVPWTKSILLDDNDNEINFVKILVKIDDTLVVTYGSDTTDAPNNQILVIPGTYSDAVNYAVELTVVDTVGQSSKYTTTIATVSRPLSVRAFMDSQTGTKKWGMAIGKISEIPEVLEVDVPEHLYKNLILRSSNIDTSRTPTAGLYGTPEITFLDTENRYAARILNYESVNGGHYTFIRSYKVVNGSQTYHQLGLGVLSDGTLTVDFGGTAGKNAWLSALGITGNYVKGMSNVVIRDTTHKYTIAAYSHKDFTVDLTTLGATLANQMVGFSVLCDNNANLIVTMCSSSGNGVTFRVHNPTNSSQTMGGVVGILKYLSK